MARKRRMWRYIGNGRNVGVISEEWMCIFGEPEEWGFSVRICLLEISEISEKPHLEDLINMAA